MKFSFESHDEDDELYLPIPAFRYEQLIECESAMDQLQRQVTYDYRHDDYSKYKDGLASYKPLEVLQMMGLHGVVEALIKERKNAAENQES